MELSVGMYVRTKNGEIGKCTHITKNKEIISADGNKRRLKDADEYTVYTLPRKVIVKASHSIIDLIQVGDYVNGRVVTEIIPENRKIEPSTMIYTGTNYYVGLYNEHIKSIVTKEYFESGSYKVGE